MKEFIEKCGKFFAGIFERIGLFFRKLTEKVNGRLSYLVQKIRNFPEKSRQKRQTRREEKQRLRQERKLKKQEEAAQKKLSSAQPGKKAVRVFLNAFDVIFEVIFFCGLIFCIRPEILNFEKSNSYFEQFDFDSVKLVLFGKFLPEPSGEISNLAVLVITCAFAFYLLYKIVFSLVSANGINKLVSVLLTAITFVSVTLIKDKFLIFLVLYILLFATFQFSCGLKFKAIRIKFLFIVLLSLAAYIFVLYAFDGFFRQCMILIFSEIKLPVKLF